MKKTAILAAALLLFTTACGKKDSAPAAEPAEPAAAAEAAPSAAPENSDDKRRLLELIAHNSIDSVLNNHGSYSFSRVISSQDQEIGTEYWFTDQDRFYYEASDQQAMYVTGSEYVLTVPEESGTAGAILANPQEVYQEWLDQVKESNSFTLGSNDSVTDLFERETHIYVTTAAPAGETTKNLYEYFSSAYGGPQYQEGIEVKCYYEFDAETSDFVSIENVFTDSAGNTVLSIKDTYNYGSEFTPNQVNSVLADWLNGNRPRRIQITFNSGTDQAVTQEFWLTQGMAFSVYNNDAYSEEVYVDAACTTPLGESDRVSDLVLFVK